MWESGPYKHPNQGNNMTPSEALDIHANPDGHTGTLWRVVRAAVRGAA